MSDPAVVLEIRGDFGIFYCPGCKNSHTVRLKGSSAWGWNGDVIAPTLFPSVLVSGGHYTPGYNEGMTCWCTHNEGKPDDEIDFKCQLCHSYVRDGQIQFLADCSHELANQTVPLTPRPQREPVATG